MEERLRKFAQVVEHGGFSKAALALHISQPALTTAVKKLERELGTTLLTRDTKRVVMTPAGKFAYQASKEFDTHTFNLKQRLLVLAGGRPTVRLGMIDSMADTLAAETNGFAGLKQATDLSVVVDNSRQLILDVATEALEAAIIVDSRDSLPDGLVTERLGSEPLLLVVHPTHQRHYQAALQRGRIPNFLSYNSGSHTLHIINQTFAEKTITAEPAFYSTSPEVMLKMVLLRQGAAILPYSLVKRQLLEAAVVPVMPQSTTFSRPLCTIYYQRHLLPAPLTQTFATAGAALRKLTVEARQAIL